MASTPFDCNWTDTKLFPLLLVTVLTWIVNPMMRTVRKIASFMTSSYYSLSFQTLSDDIRQLVAVFYIISNDFLHKAPAKCFSRLNHLLIQMLFHWEPWHVINYARQIIIKNVSAPLSGEKGWRLEYDKNTLTKHQLVFLLHESWSFLVGFALVKLFHTEWKLNNFQGRVLGLRKKGKFSDWWCNKVVDIKEKILRFNFIFMFVLGCTDYIVDMHFLPAPVFHALPSPPPPSLTLERKIAIMQMLPEKFVCFSPSLDFCRCFATKKIFCLVELHGATLNVATVSGIWKSFKLFTFTDDDEEKLM